MLFEGLNIMFVKKHDFNKKKKIGKNCGIRARFSSKLYDEKVRKFKKRKALYFQKYKE